MSIKIKQLYWLSFASDKGNLGICIISGSSLKDAIKQSSLNGLNPGGEVLGIPIPPDDEKNIPKSIINKLFSKEEIAKHFSDLVNPDELEIPNEYIVCEDCNEKCSERLPENDITVLGFDKEYPYNYDFVIFDEFFRNRDNEEGRAFSVNITHLMPLPEPPNEQ